MIYLEKSFGCLSLRTGGLIIGWINIIGCILGFLSSIVMLIVISNCDLESEHKNGFCTKENSYLLSLFWVSLVISLIHLIPAALLIHGIRKNRHTLLRPMLVFMVVETILGIIEFLFSLAHPEIDLIFEFLGIILSIYLFMCIYSLFNQIRESTINNSSNKV